MPFVIDLAELVTLTTGQIITSINNQFVVPMVLFYVILTALIILITGLVMLKEDFFMFFKIWIIGVIISGVIIAIGLFLPNQVISGYEAVISIFA